MRWGEGRETYGEGLRGVRLSEERGARGRKREKEGEEEEARAGGES